MNRKEDQLIIGNRLIEFGQQARVSLPVARLYDSTEMNIQIEVIRGKEPGPILFVSAAIHGDEINGTEIIRRLLKKKKTLSRLKGTLLLIPVVNVFGFNSRSRFLPDRRDLNRCFPGNSRGSLASRMANIFMNEIVSKCSHGIDLHTGSLNRTNFPQIRAFLGHKKTKKMALDFGAPVILDSRFKDGSLRQVVTEKGIPILLFEAGEALRFNEKYIRVGVQGIVNVMVSLGMLDKSNNGKEMLNQPFIAKSSYWVRSPASGILKTNSVLGYEVKKGDELGVISNSFGRDSTVIIAPYTGIVIGMMQMPLVNRGDAIFHIATYQKNHEFETNWNDNNWSLLRSDD